MMSQNKPLEKDKQGEKDGHHSAKMRKKGGKKLFEEELQQSVTVLDNEEKQVSFTPASIELFGETELVNCSTQKKVKATNALSNKVIGLYFSAGWCPPCLKFTPVLKDLYNELKQRGWPFEVVFISCDKTEEGMEEYLPHHGNWFYVPFNEEIASTLKIRYDIRLVPRLIIIKESGSIITSTGRKEVQDRGVSCYRHWLESAGLDLQLLKRLQRLELKGGDEALQNATPEPQETTQEVTNERP